MYAVQRSKLSVLNVFSLHFQHENSECMLKICVLHTGKMILQAEDRTVITTYWHLDAHKILSMKILYINVVYCKRYTPRMTSNGILLTIVKKTHIIEQAFTGTLFCSVQSFFKYWLQKALHRSNVVPIKSFSATCLFFVRDEVNIKNQTEKIQKKGHQ